MSYLKPLLLLLLLTAIAYTQINPEDVSRDAAIKIAQQEALTNPNSFEAYFRLGEAYLVHYYSVANKAAEAFQKAIWLNPNRAEAYYKLALALDRDHRHHFQERHPKEGTKALRKAIQLKSDYAEAYVQSARTYMANPTWSNLKLEKTYKPAVELLTKAIEIKPDLAEAYEELSRAYEVLKEDEKAREAKKKTEDLKKEKK